jgi:hypothetical protein
MGKKRNIVGKVYIDLVSWLGPGFKNNLFSSLILKKFYIWER